MYVIILANFIFDGIKCSLINYDYDILFLAATGAPPMNQQAHHGQPINQVQQQQPMPHMQGAGKFKLNSEQYS